MMIDLYEWGKYEDASAQRDSRARLVRQVATQIEEGCFVEVFQQYQQNNRPPDDDSGSGQKLSDAAWRERNWRISLQRQTFSIEGVHTAQLAAVVRASNGPSIGNLALVQVLCQALGFADFVPALSAVVAYLEGNHPSG